MTLPRGWEATTIGDIVEKVESFNPELTPDLDIVYVDIGSIDNKRLKIVEPKVMKGRDAPSRARRRIRSGDVLFSTVRPYLKNIAVVPDELDEQYTSTGICVLRASAGIEASFIFYRVISQDFIDAMTVASDGTMYPAISDGDVWAAKIALPPSQEQRRIVDKLDSLSSRMVKARDELSRSEIMIDRLRKNILGAQIGKLLSNAGTVPASKYFKWSSGKFLPKSSQRPGSVPVFGGNGINGYHDQKLISERTLVVGRVGAQCGNVHLTPSESWITDNAIYAQRIDEKIDLRFALHVFRIADLIQKAAGTGQPYVNQDALNSVPFPDISKQEQKAVADKIESAFASVDRVDAEIRRAAHLLDRLESAILAKAFRGELVAQNPLDEPASVLLNRISSDRLARPGRKRRTGK